MIDNMTAPDDLMGIEIEELISRCAGFLRRDGGEPDHHLPATTATSSQGMLFPLVDSVAGTRLRRPCQIVARIRANEIVEYAKRHRIKVDPDAVRILPFRTCHSGHARRSGLSRIADFSDFILAAA